MSMCLGSLQAPDMKAQTELESVKCDSICPSPALTALKQF